ncbi:hypothetical protein PIB30_069277 [Stylosanthes scabra]|uniref:Uncharacterized protein n=1 Tax=Stylosanthes scabra TaxID=79078 RepID=A0ABU6WP50_9FABA|nr:hypothetical protein [Stylosanthes scabra]
MVLVFEEKGKRKIGVFTRDPIVLPRDCPARGRRARNQRPDVRRKGEGEARDRPEQGHRYRPLGGEDTNEEAEFHQQDDIPERVDVHDQAGADTIAQEAECGGDQVGADTMGHDEEIDFFNGTDLELARFIFQGEGSGSRFAPHASADRPSGFQRHGHTTLIYELFTCGDDVMDQIAQGYLAARGSRNG